MPKDPAEAAKWYGRAAKQGNAPAQFFAGVAYATGERGLTDEIQTLAWMSLLYVVGSSCWFRFKNKGEKTRKPIP